MVETWLIHKDKVRGVVLASILREDFNVEALTRLNNETVVFTTTYRVPQGDVRVVRVIELGEVGGEIGCFDTYSTVHVLIVGLEVTNFQSGPPLDVSERLLTVWMVSAVDRVNAEGGSARGPMSRAGLANLSATLGGTLTDTAWAAIWCVCTAKDVLEEGETQLRVRVASCEL